MAHLNLPVPPEIGPLLVRASARKVLNQVLGQPPVGLRRALSRLPDAVLSRENYKRLVDLLVDPQAAKILHHADQIDDTAIRVLTDLPQKLRVGRLPLPEAMPPATVGNARRLDRVIRFARSPGRGGIASLAMAALSMVAAAPSTSGRNAERPAACLINRHGRLGWLMDEVKGPRNSEVEPQQFAVIGTAFADVGVPSSQVVSAIENIIYADSGALRPMDED